MADPHDLRTQHDESARRNTHYRETLAELRRERAKLARRIEAVPGISGALARMSLRAEDRDLAQREAAAERLLARTQAEQAHASRELERLFLADIDAQTEADRAKAAERDRAQREADAPAAPEDASPSRPADDGRGLDHDDDWDGWDPAPKTEEERRELAAEWAGVVREDKLPKLNRERDEAAGRRAGRDAEAQTKIAEANRARWPWQRARREEALLEMGYADTQAQREARTVAHVQDRVDAAREQLHEWEAEAAPPAPEPEPQRQASAPQIQPAARQAEPPGAPEL